MALRSISVCTGVGGLDLALDIACPGTVPLVYVEREVSAIRILAARIEEGSLGRAHVWADLATFDASQLRGSADVLLGGIPCQPFSIAGKRAGTDDERWVWEDVRRIIADSGVWLVWLENVPGILLDPDSETDRWELDKVSDDAPGGMGTILRDLAVLGFDAEWLCLRASDVGASHRRKRWFLLAYRSGAEWRQNIEHIELSEGWIETAGGSRSAGEGMEHAEFPRLDWTERQRVRTDGPSLQAARSLRDDGAVAHAGLSERWRPEESAGFDRRRTPDDDCGAGRALADSVDRLIPHPRRGSGERDGAGSAEPFLEDAARNGQHGFLGEDGRGGRRGVCESGDQLEHPEHGGYKDGRAESRGSVRNGGHEDQRSEAQDAGEILAIAAEPGLPGRSDQARDGGEAFGIEAAERADTELVNAPQRGCGELREPPEIGIGQPDGTNEELGIFAPGPGDPSWSEVLVQKPWLCPALSQAEAESIFRDVADGMAALVADERTAALRAAGNGVVVLQAAVAFTVLARRIEMSIPLEAA